MCVYLHEVENKRINGKVVQRYIRYIGKEVNGEKVISISSKDLQVDSVKIYGPLLVFHRISQKIKLPEVLGEYSNEILPAYAGDFVTSFVQFDQLETYEHTKRKPVGIQISVRCKTKEIISARVGYIPIRALTVSKAYSTEWNSKITDSRIREMLLRTKTVLNKKGALISCDRENQQVNLLKKLCTEPHITVAPSSSENKIIDRVFRRMRQDISRLGRKTLSTTKDISELQKHLDLYTDYHNLKRAA